MFDACFLDSIAGFVNPGFYLLVSAQLKGLVRRSQGSGGSRKGSPETYSVVNDPLDGHQYSERERHDYIQ